MLFSQPDANLVIASKAVRGLEFCLQGCQGGRSDTLADGRLGPLLAQCLV